MHVLNLGVAGFCINKPEHDAGFFDGLIGAVDTNLLDGVCGLTNTSCVDKTEGDTVDVDSVFDGVASSTMDVANDGTIIFQERIQ